MAQPDWISEAAHAERWDDGHWNEWDRCSRRMRNLGIHSIEPIDGGLSIGGPDVALSEPVQAHEERPLLAALHRLEARLGEHLGHRPESG